VAEAGQPVGLKVPSIPAKLIVRLRPAVAVHAMELPNTIALWGHAKMSVGEAPTDVTTVVAPLENPLAAYDSPSATPASDGRYETEQLFAAAAIVHDFEENVPEPVVLNANVSVGAPTAVQFVAVPNVTVLGEQLRGGRFAAKALAGLPTKPATTTAAAQASPLAARLRRERHLSLGTIARVRALTDSSAGASASQAAGSAVRESRAPRS
jgi:hypothetical protein